MPYQQFITFLKTHNLYNEEVLTYWKKHKISFDYREEETREMIGCYYQYNNNILTQIKLIVPFIDNEKTILINIHEYIHLLLLYKKIGKKHKIGLDKEVLPILFERLFIKENETPELKKYYEILNQTIKDNNIEEYVIALKLSNSLIKEYQREPISILDKKVKRLIKKRIHEKTSYI